MDLSIVIPIKDECDNLREMHRRVQAALQPLRLTYEIIFVDDGSSDGSFETMEQLAFCDSGVKVVRLSRHFGQSAALQAGIDYSSGAVLVTMDGDLQNDPGDIPVFLEKLQEGFDAVLGHRMKRADSFVFRTLPSQIANWLIRRITGTRTRDLGCTFRTMRRELAESLTLYGEMHRFINIFVEQNGCRLAQIPVRHHLRAAGKSKYTLSRSLRVLLDLITVTFMNKYLTRPMHIMGLAGLFSIGLGFVSLIATVCMKAGYGIFMTGNPLLLFSAICVLAGIQFLSMGLIGEVIMRTYFESQGKRSYSIRTVVNIKGCETMRLSPRFPERQSKTTKRDTLN